MPARRSRTKASERKGGAPSGSCKGARNFVFSPHRTKGDLPWRPPVHKDLGSTPASKHGVSKPPGTASRRSIRNPARVRDWFLARTDEKIMRSAVDFQRRHEHRTLGCRVCASSSAIANDCSQGGRNMRWIRKLLTEVSARLPIAWDGLAAMAY
jgi:hypothetical protein